ELDESKNFFKKIRGTCQYTFWSNSLENVHPNKSEDVAAKLVLRDVFFILQLVAVGVLSFLGRFTENIDRVWLSIYIIVAQPAVSCILVFHDLTVGKTHINIALEEVVDCDKYIHNTILLPTVSFNMFSKIKINIHPFFTLPHYLAHAHITNNLFIIFNISSLVHNMTRAFRRYIFFFQKKNYSLCLIALPDFDEEYNNSYAPVVVFIFTCKPIGCNKGMINDSSDFTIDLGQSTDNWKPHFFPHIQHTIR
ncbi:hypothetical protein ACJX0J_009487, partial [Zea mays]